MSFIDSVFRLNSLPSFAKLLIREMKAAGDPRESKFDASEKRIVFYDGNRQIGYASLTNIHQEYLAQPSASRNTFLKQSVRSLLSTHKRPPSEFADASPDLLPTVRARSYSTSMELHARDSGEPSFVWPHIAIGEHLAVGIVYDLPESMILIQQDQLDEWGVSFLEAFEIARENLSHLDGTLTSIDNRLYIADSKDNFDATRLLMVEWIKRLRVDGAPVAMVPDRDTLLITGSRDEKGLTMMTRMAREAVERPRRINTITFRLDDDAWQPWLPDESFECFSGIQMLNLESIAHEYNYQKSLIDERQTDPKVFIASFNILPRENDATSYAVWSEGVDTLLPQTDEIAFAKREILDSNDPPYRVPWHIVQKILFERLAQYPMYPIRYFVDSFPTDAEFQHMQFLMDEE